MMEVVQRYLDNRGPTLQLNAGNNASRNQAKYLNYSTPG